MLQDITLIGQQHNICRRRPGQCLLGRGASGELTVERWPTHTVAMELLKELASGHHTAWPATQYVPEVTGAVCIGKRGVRGGAYRGAVADKDSSSGAVSDIPQADGAVAGACGNVVAVGMPLHHIHIRLVPCSVEHQHVNSFS